MQQVFSAAQAGAEESGLHNITAVKMLKTDLVEPAERCLIARAEQIISQFSMSSLTAQPSETTTITTQRPAATFAQTEDTRSRATSALLTLYLLSPVSHTRRTAFEATHLRTALAEYLRRAITSSVAGLSSGLAQLPRLDRTLLEISARCQNIVALEILLESIKPPPHILLQGGEVVEEGNTLKTTQDLSLIHI